MTTPGTPPSRTSRLEPTPITVTATSAGLLARKADEVVAVGRTEHHLGRAADAEPGDARERRILGQAATHGRQPLDQALRSHCRRHHCDFLSA